MTNSNALTASNIRYLLTMKELDGDGRGVRCIALATALGLSKPSVHNMMGTFSQMGLISRDSYGAAFFTDEGNELARRYGNICIGMGATIMGVLGLIMMFICPLLFAMLTPDPAVRELSAQVLRIELLAEPLFGASIVAAGALRGAGDTLVPSVINLATMWVVRIGLALILIKPLGLLGMWIAMAAELSTRGLLMLYRQRTSRFYAMYAGQSKA